MSDQLQMFGPVTCEVTPNATSSRESESGVTPCDSPDGKTTARCGPAPAPASPSARPVKAKRSTTKGIFGQSGFHSSKHEDLSFALASKYRALTDSLGSTLFTLTWSTRITPSGFSIPAQRASEPRTEDTVCIGWPTPQKHDERERGNTMADHHYFPHDLSNAATLAGWPTTQSSDMTGGGQAKRSDGRANLNDFAMLAGWKTPTACSPNSLRGSGQEPADREAGGHAVNIQDQVRLVAWKTPCVPNGGRISGNPTDIGKHQDGTKAQIGLENEAKLSGWATPKVATGDYQYAKGDHLKPILNLSGEVRLTAFGETPIGYLLGPNGWEIVPACGQLNASHSRWLMSLPASWDVAAIRAFRSLKKRKRE
jgi:hypothetical protein